MNKERLESRVPAPEEFQRTRQILREGVASKVAPGFVAGIWKAAQGRQVSLLAEGLRRAVPSEQPMSAETVFDLASLTKVVATAPAMGALVERGWMDWDTPVRAILPEMGEFPEGGQMRVRHLLSHTGGLPAWHPLWEKLRHAFAGRDLTQIPVEIRQREMRRQVFGILPEAPVDTKTCYSDISFLLLGFIIEEVTGLPLDRAVAQWVWEPMEIEGFSFRRVVHPVSAVCDQAVAATEECPWRKGVLQGQVHDDNCWAMGGYGGHAGAFGRAVDVLTFAERLWNGFFSPRTLQKFLTRVELPVGCDRTFGWDTPSGQLPSVGSHFSNATIGHLGFTGTSLWIDWPAGIAVTLLSNRVHPSRENNLIRPFRPRFHDAVRLDLKS